MWSAILACKRKHTRYSPSLRAEHVCIAWLGTFQGKEIKRLYRSWKGGIYSLQLYRLRAQFAWDNKALTHVTIIKSFKSVWNAGDRLPKVCFDKYARGLQHQRQRCRLFFQSAFWVMSWEKWRHWLSGTVCEVKHGLETNHVVCMVPQHDSDLLSGRWPHLGHLASVIAQSAN